MEKFQVLRENAKKTVRMADHILTVTYPLLKDPKILVSAAKNIFSAAEQAMTSVLEHERLFKRIPSYQDNFESKFRVFKEKIVPRHNISPGHVKTIRELKDILSAHKESPVEFTRKEKYVICSDDYDMKTLSEKQLKNHLKNTKIFIEQASLLTTKNERIFR